MRVIIQRVTGASVAVDDRVIAAIDAGLLVFLGIEEADTEADIVWLSGKITGLRIFDDGDGVMNRSLRDCDGEILLVSQFTLHASTKKGNRPSYIRAAKAPFAIPLYEKMVRQLEADLTKKIHTGVFGADMQVQLVNDGPVTIYIDSKNRE